MCKSKWSPTLIKQNNAAVQILMETCTRQELPTFGLLPPLSQDVAGLGPLHTRAKSHVREIVRVQKKVSKGRPNTPPKSCNVVTAPCRIDFWTIV